MDDEQERESDKDRELREARYDTQMILIHAISDAYDEMVKNWNPFKEMGFVMVRRALRHLTLGSGDMY